MSEIRNGGENKIEHLNFRRDTCDIKNAVVAQRIFFFRFSLSKTITLHKTNLSPEKKRMTSVT